MNGVRKQKFSLYEHPRTSKNSYKVHTMELWLRLKVIVDVSEWPFAPRVRKITNAAIWTLLFFLFLFSISL